ncbi:hypothetical protein [Gordonia zhaorongruii]|uniref:hypothetical protein n=1 Tax=Gordonia zhaorongruii TaxID=2597659 RepID=UPI001045E688|nr:hypothetical protein [Gordonia zhaorongruii]
MTDNERDSRGDAAGGNDPVKDMLLGFAANIDQLAGLIGGTTTGFGPDTSSGPIPELAGELGGLLKELGDLLARILAAFIAVLEAIAEMLRSTPPDTARPSPFETIPVRITTVRP